MNNSFIKKTALITFYFLVINMNSQNICFNNSESYATDVSGSAIVSAPGDFNGDGIKDLAVFRNNASNPIAIMLGDNAGNYTYSYGTNAFCFYAGSAPVFSFKAADFNNDSYDDLIISSIHGEMRVLMNNTNNSFSLGYWYTTTLTNAVQSYVVVDDFNNDSNMDIIMTSAVSPNKMRIFIGSGNGSFVVGTDFNGSTGEIVSGDFNSDGNKDIALAAGTSIICMFGMGNCTFTSAGSVSVGANILSIVPGDFNNDNMLDIASIDQSTSTPLFVRTFLGNNNGTFLANGNYPISAIPSGPLTTKDFNNDGFLDIAGALSDNTFFILPGKLLGKFSQEIMYSAPVGIRSIISFDTNNDGEEDIISSSETSHKICTFYGNGTLAFNTASVFGSKNLHNSDRPFRNAVADYDCDGKNDIASASSFLDSVSILYNKGNNLLKEKRYKCSGYAQSLAKGDFNNDGLADIAILDNGITILQNTCSGTFSSITAVSGSSILNKRGMIARDFNSDSNIDLLVINSGDIKIYLGNGNSGFASPIVYALSMPRGAAVSDYNGDGVLDIAITNNTTSLFVFLGIGDGTFITPITVSLSFPGLYVSTADFNNDGIFDLAVNHGNASATQGAVSVLIGDGSAGFSNIATYNSGGNFTITTGIADMNGDGKQDMVIGSLNSGYTSNPYSSYTYNGLAVYLGNGAGGFTYKPFNVPLDAQVVLPEDIDNDGTIDIVATYNEKITVFTNQSPQISTVSNTTICQPPPVVLKATKNLYSYTWHPGNSSLDSLVVTTSGQYYVSYHNKNNTCSLNSNTITVKVIPTLSISPITAICFNTSANLNVTGANTYTWNTGAITPSITVTPTINATYTVTGKDVLGCINTQTIAVSVNPLPTISVNSGSICSGDSFTFTPTGGVTYTYSSGSAIISPLISSTYTISGADASGCYGTATSSITVFPLPISVNSGSICIGESFTFTPTGATNYTYSSSSSVITPTTTSTYTIVGETNGCSDTLLTTVIVNTLPVLSITPTNSICANSNAYLNVSGANTYTWNTGAITPSIVVTPTTTSIYTVTGTDINNCSSTQTVSVLVDNTCADIWPGDANSDGIADNLDVLELGLHYTQTGSPRASVSNTWQSYFANNWTGTITNGKNLNHSDCNGDGTIDDNDTLAIYNNYGLTHAFKPEQAAVINPQLSIVPDQAYVTKGNWGTASIYVGDAITSINNINGLAFTVDFDNTLIETNSIYIEYQNSFLNAGQNLHFRKLDFANAKIFTATTHTVNNNVSGNGLIAKLHYQIKSSLTTDEVLNIGLTQANQSNASGVITPLTTGTGTLMAIGASVGLQELNGNMISISPNPTNGSLTIRSKTELQKIEVITVTGQILLSETPTNVSHTVQLDDFANGIYFVNLYQNNRIVKREKVVLNK